MNKFKLPGLIPYTKYLFYWPDHNVDLMVVIGKSIQFPKIENPNGDEINKYHSEYLKNLERIHHKYKLNKNDKLVIM